MRHKALILLFLVLVSGCINRTTAPESIDAVTKSLHPPEGLALVYVLRPWALRSGAGSVPLQYSGGPLGFIGTDQYLAFYTPSDGIQFGEPGHSDSLSVDVEAGKTYFVKMEFNMRLNPLAQATFSLLDEGAGRALVDEYTLSGSNPFSYACGFGDLDVIRDLYSHNLEHSSKEDQLFQESACMVIAAGKGQMEVIKWGHEIARLPINNLVWGLSQSAVPSTPLKAAMDGYNLQIAEYLLDNGALTHAIGENLQFLAINRAVDLRSLDLVTLLISKSANPNSFLEGETPLVKAIKTNQPDIAKYLLANGAYVSYYDSEIQDPLTIARQTGNREFEELLLASGAIDRQEIARREKVNLKARNQATVDQLGDIATTVLGVALGVAAVYYTNDVTPVYYPTSPQKSSVSRHQQTSSPQRPTRTSASVPSLRPSTVSTSSSRPIETDVCSGYKTSMDNCYEYDLSRPGDQIRYEIDESAKLRDSLDVSPEREIEQGIGQYGGGVLND